MLESINGDSDLLTGTAELVSRLNKDFPWFGGSWREKVKCLSSNVEDAESNKGYSTYVVCSIVNQEMSMRCQLT